MKRMNGCVDLLPPMSPSTSAAGNQLLPNRKKVLRPFLSCDTSNDLVFTLGVVVVMFYVWFSIILLFWRRSSCRANLLPVVFKSGPEKFRKLFKSTSFHHFVCILFCDWDILLTLCRPEATWMKNIFLKSQNWLLFKCNLLFTWTFTFNRLLIYIHCTFDI